MIDGGRWCCGAAAAVRATVPVRGQHARRTSATGCARRRAVRDPQQVRVRGRRGADDLDGAARAGIGVRTRLNGQRGRSDTHRTSRARDRHGAVPSPTSMRASVVGDLYTRLKLLAVARRVRKKRLFRGARTGGGDVVSASAAADARGADPAAAGPTADVRPPATPARDGIWRSTGRRSATSRSTPTGRRPAAAGGPRGQG